MTEITAEQADALLERIARLEAEAIGEKASKAAHDASLAELAKPSAPKPAGGWMREQGRAQEEARQIRREAHEEATRMLDEQLERARPKIANLEQQLAALATKDGEERARHARAIEAIEDQRRELTRKLGDLQRPKVTVEQILARPDRQAALTEISDRVVQVLMPVGFSYKPAAPMSATRGGFGPLGG